MPVAGIALLDAGIALPDPSLDDGHGALTEGIPVLACIWDIAAPPVFAQGAVVPGVVVVAIGGTSLLGAGCCGA